MLVVLHELGLVLKLVRAVEKKPSAKPVRGAEMRVLLRLLKSSHVVEARRDVRVVNDITLG